MFANEKTRDIVIEDLSRSFGDKKVLDNFCATFPHGKVSVIVGASGCGKTTLLRILMGLETPDGGRVTGLEGARIAAVFQEDRLIHERDAIYNIRLVNSKLSREEIIAAMKAVGLVGCERQPVRELSGGMRRRVSLLRALLSDFDLLLLDEPFKGLDPDTRAETAKFVRDTLGGRSAIAVSHDSPDAELLGASCIVEMSRK